MNINIKLFKVRKYSAFTYTSLRSIWFALPLLHNPANWIHLSRHTHHNGFAAESATILEIDIFSIRPSLGSHTLPKPWYILSICFWWRLISSVPPSLIVLRLSQKLEIPYLKLVYFRHQKTTRPNTLLGGTSQADVLWFTCRRGNNNLFAGTQTSVSASHHEHISLVDLLFLISLAQQKSVSTFNSCLVYPEKRFPRSQIPLMSRSTRLTAFECADVGESQNWAGLPTKKTRSGRVPITK